MTKMASKTSFILIAFGLICLLQTTPINATNKHAGELLKAFRRIQFDWTKKSFYLHSAKYGVQVQLREPLVKKALGLSDDVNLSTPCLNQMVTKVHDLEDTFYAGFSYGCEIPDQQYTVECLEAAKPNYLNGLEELRSETEKCLEAE
ncbi:gSG7 salivary protein [Anopheles sinensis]|uniref:GSG7 salivary protein n=1 Tax=Anopheles sinensis TaxID=74873 RepID=A0A084VFY0_ANOSI|nr:gSG7 salivary protein [Anopheles sinensis]